MTPTSYARRQRPITDTQLQAFVTVAESGSFTRAARQLRSSQSAVSHSVAALEQTLGVALFVREACGVRLSLAGEQTLEHARAVLRNKEAIYREAGAARDLSDGIVRVGSFGPTSSRHLLPPILEACAKRHRRLSVRIVEGSDQEVEQWLREGELDAGFVNLPNDEFETLQLARDEMVVLLAADSPLAAEARVPPERLADLPFIISTGGCEPLVRELLDERLLDARYHIREVQTIVDMVRQGIGISIKPALSLPAELPEGVVTRPLAPARTREIGIAWRDRSDLSPAVRAFIRVASDAGKAAVPSIVPYKQ